MAEKKLSPADCFFDKYQLGEELGRGAFSIVKVGFNKETKEKVAVKLIEKKNVAPEYKKNLDAETQILQDVKHSHIIRLIELYDTEEFLILVMECVTGGELFDRIVSKGCYTEDETSRLIKSVVEAMKYLHEKGICHRDLKPENLLLASEDDDVDIRVADFGLSKVISKKVMMQTACGTPGYVAPEVLSATGYGKEVDMWSVGVITYILLCGFPPFYGDNVPELFEQILNSSYDYPEEYWANVSEEARNFIDRLLVVEIEDRMTAEQALEHPFLNGEKSKNPLEIGKDLSKLQTNRRANSTKFAGNFDL